MCIDNDDGSCYYKLYENFEVYGGHKSDFGGHNKFTYDSVVPYAQDYSGSLCGNFNDAIPGFTDGYWNNTCIQEKTGYYASLDSCDPNNPNPTVLPVMHDNIIFNPAGKVTIKCGNSEIALDQWQAKGFDKGTTAHVLPSDAEIISMGKALLGIVTNVKN